MRSRAPNRLPLLCALLCGVAGCVSGRIPPNLYVLTPPATDAVPAQATGDVRHLYVDPVRLPDFLDSTDLLVRRGPAEVVPSPTGRWGERLAAGIHDALVTDLRERLPAGTLIEARDRDPLARHLAVSVTAFDAWANGHVVLVASWTLVAGLHGEQLAADQGTFSIPAAASPAHDGDAAIVAAMTAALAALSDRLAGSGLR